MSKRSAWLLGCLIFIFRTASAATYTVDNANDASTGSLRQAILDANANPGKDTITFNIPGVGLQTIAPLTPLPTIVDPLTMDGYTQPGASVNTFSSGNNAVLRIELSGVNLTAPAHGLWIATTNCVVRGLVINRFTNDAVGILVEGFDGNVIEGNFIGTDATGTTALGNGTGILISDSTGNRIGGTAAASRNIIGGNQNGISFNVTTGNEVIGNYVGLGADGLATVSNLSGIFLHYSTGAQIGGSTPGARNVVSGNGNGITVNVGVSNLIQGNFVGTDASGTLSRGNATGISLNESSHNLIGGASAGDGNLLSGNLGSGVLLNGLDAKSNLISGNLIGTDVTGKAALGNGDYGVFIGAASGNRVGGADSGARNVISGNGWQGIAIYHYGGATGNVIQGNLIGTDITGTNGLGNKMGGIRIAAPGNLVGGTKAGAGNVISGNTGYGMILVDSGSNNVVQGNVVGLDASGLCPLGNSEGIVITGASGNLIGGTESGARNVVSGNTNGSAFNVVLFAATANRIEGNYIGPDVLGNGPISNGYGIWIGEAYRNTVGGIEPGAGNLIAYNYAGVVLQFAGTTNNAILGNSIFANELLGIDLGADGATDNDVLDTDAGPNQLQNFPVIVSATSSGGTTIQGTLVGAPNRSYRLEFFSNDLPLEPSEHGEGKIFLGSLDVTTDGTGSETFAFHTASAVTLDQLITATATDPDGNTSEFSRATPITGAPAVGSISVTAGLLGSSVVIVGTNFSSVASNNIVWFGGVRAQAISASSTELVVNVPPGASYAPVSVTTGGLTAYSLIPFAVTFPSLGGLEPTSFAPSADIGFGTSLAATALADVDADGRLDLVVANQGSGVVRVFRNQGTIGVLASNSFAAPLTFPVGGLPNSVVMADIDGDGWLDVVTADSSAPLLSVLRNMSAPGTISFAATVTMSLDGTAHPGLTVADFDGDGRTDVATANSGTNTISVMQNLSWPGTVLLASAVSLPVGVTPIRLAAGDLDGDAHPDIVAVSAAGARLMVIRSLGIAGSLTTNSFAPKFDLASPSAPYDVAVGDVDGDGRPDLAAANSQNLVSVWRNVSAPGSLAPSSFSARVDFPVARSVNAAGFPWTVGLVDLNGDAKPEIFTANYKTNFVSVLRNRATPGSLDTNSFSPWIGFPTAFGPFHVVAGDLDGDGRPDLVSANTPGNTVSLLRNVIPPVCDPQPVGIVGWWPGEGTPNDVIGGRNGSTIGTVQYPQGRVGQAFNFDGNGFDYLEMPSAPALSPHAGSSGEMTLEAWILIRSLPINEIVRVIHKVEASLGWEYELMMDRAGRAHFAMSSANASIGYTATGGALSLFQWHHVVGTYRAGQFIRLYVDGALVHEILDPNLFTAATPAAFAIGGSPYFNGMLDEVTLYDRALSGNEVAGLAAAGSAGKCPGCEPPPSGLVAWLRAEDNVLNAVGTGHGVAAGGTGFTTGRVGRGFDLSAGTNVIRVPDGPALRPASVSVEAWIKADTSPGISSYLVSKALAVGYGSYALFSGPNEGLIFYVSTPSESFVYSADAGSGIWDGDWHHVVGTFDGEFVRLFVDGSMVGSEVAAAGPIQYGTNYHDGTLFIGGHELTGIHNWAGMLDEVSLYSRALTPGEVFALFAAGGTGKCPLAPLLIGVQGGGGVARSPDKPLYHYGESVTLTATNRSHFTFLRWSDGVTSVSRMVNAGLVDNLAAIFTNTVPLETLGFKQWDRSFGGLAADNYPVVRQTSDGGYVLAGATYSGIGGNKATELCGTAAAWVVKLDADGNKQWEQTVGAPGDALYLVDIVQTADGGFALGTSASAVPGPLVGENCGRTSSGFGAHDFWLVRLDASGQRLWDTSFGGDGVDALGAIKALPDGGFVLVGSSSSGMSGNKTSPNFGTNDFWVVRTDASGNKIWDRSFGGNDIENAFSVSPTADGGFFVSGISLSDISGNKTAANHGQRDYWCLRLDAAGNKLWDRSYGGDFDESGAWLAPMPDGGAVLAGYSDSPPSGTRTAPNQGSSGSDYWLVRIDGDGEQLWDHSFGGSGEYDWAYNVTATSDGGVMVVGESDSGIDGNKTTAQIGGSDGWVVRIDPWGEKVSEVSLGGTDYDYLWSVDMAGPDAFILAGGSYSDPSGNKSAPNWGNEDFWLVKMVERTAPIGTPAILANGQFSPTNSFFVTNSAMVAIQTSYPDGHIFYTLNDAPPGTWTTYSGPFPVNQSVTVRAIAYNADYSGSAESVPVTISIVTSPLITLQPEGAVAPVGTDVLLFIEAVGATPLSYQWFADGNPIDNATNSFLLHTNLQQTNGGSYQAVVTNPHGSATSEVALLQVLLPPDLLTQPPSMSASPGQTANFCVSVLGSEPLQFQWRKNGESLPGETNSCLVITNVQVSDGGSYSVDIANGAGVVASAPAALTVVLPVVPPGDYFSNRVAVADITGAIRGTNVFTTRETNEPLHAGKNGSNSVWYTWTAPANGITTFRTAGSAFDTLLGVYTGDSVTNLAEVARDEDGGGFFTSEARFNATGGTTYQIAIDGFAGQSGDFVFSWSLEPTVEVLPIIVTQPFSQTVNFDETVVFSVTATGSNLVYQWHRNGTPIGGATSNVLTLLKVQSANVGDYTVAITNDVLRGVISELATLEIGPFPTLRSRDKVEDLLGVSGGFGPALGGASISIGSLGTHVLDTANATHSAGEANHCAALAYSTKWLPLPVSGTATFVLDTRGATFDTILAVYVDEGGLGGVPTRLVACNDNAGLGVTWSQVTLPATNGLKYWIVVDGANGSSGTVPVNWALGEQPAFSFGIPPVATPVAREGTNLMLVTTLTDGVPPPRLQWYRNQILLENATNFTLSLGNVQRADAGTYSVIASNAIGTATSVVARVTVDIPLFIGLEPVSENGRTHFRVTGSASERFLLQGTTNFLNWIPLYTNQPPVASLDFRDYSATNRVRRFYRALPWP